MKIKQCKKLNLQIINLVKFISKVGFVMNIASKNIF